MLVDFTSNLRALFFSWATFFCDRLLQWCCSFIRYANHFSLLEVFGSGEYDWVQWRSKFLLLLGRNFNLSSLTMSRFWVMSDLVGALRIRILCGWTKPCLQQTISQKGQLIRAQWLIWWSKQNVVHLARVWSYDPTDVKRAMYHCATYQSVFWNIGAIIPITSGDKI